MNNLYTLYALYECKVKCGMFEVGDRVVLLSVFKKVQVAWPYDIWSVFEIDKDDFFDCFEHWGNRIL